VILGFIGVKLVLHALHTNELPFVNGGEPVEWAPEIPTWASLAFILATLAVSTIASLVATRRGRREPADGTAASPDTAAPAAPHIDEN